MNPLIAFLQFVLIVFVSLAFLAIAVGFAFLKNPAVGMAYVNESERRKASVRVGGK